MLQVCELLYLSTCVPNSDLLQELTVGQGALSLPSPVSLFLCVLPRNWKHLSVIHRCSFQNAKNVVWTAGFIFLEITPRFPLPTTVSWLQKQSLLFLSFSFTGLQNGISSSLNWNLLVLLDSDHEFALIIDRVLRYLTVIWKMIVHCLCIIL